MGSHQLAEDNLRRQNIFKEGNMNCTTENGNYSFKKTTAQIFFITLISYLFIIINAKCSSELQIEYAANLSVIDSLKIMQCSNECHSFISTISILNGHLFCVRDIVHVECENDFEPESEISIECERLHESLDLLQCTKMIWSKPRIYPNEPSNVLILAGGEEEGKLVNKVEVFPSSHYSSCLPNLPIPLKWGSMGMLGETLLLCGGQNAAEQPTQDCWTLDNRRNETAEWRPHINLTRPRSQSASAVSGDRSILHILSGYGTRNTGRSIYSMQSIDLKGTKKEHKLVETGGNVNWRYNSRLASAVTLANGDVLVTGGKVAGRDVFLLTGQDLQTWTHRQSMIQARLGHSSIQIMLGSEEHVMVAGGWDAQHVPQSSVELYSMGDDSWQSLPHLSSPRVDFTLQILNSKIIAIGGFQTQDTGRNFPSVATISWSPTEGWGDWTELNQGEIGNRNGFMATQVSVSWVKQLCSVRW